MDLKKHQLEAIKKGLEIIKQHNFVYLKMETRTGKTLTSLNIAQSFGAKSVLFVTKKKAIEDIEGQYKQGNFDFDIFIINFESVHKVNNEVDFLIVDEAHSLGAYPKPALRFKKLFPFRSLPMILLSATPSPESFSQLFHQFFLPIYGIFKQYKNFYKWFKDFGVPKQKRVQQQLVNDYSETQADKLNNLLEPFFVSCTQEEADFNIKILEQIAYCTQSTQIELFYKLMKRTGVIVVEGETITAKTAVARMQKCHQIASGTILDDNQNQIILSVFKANIIYLDKLQDEKIAVFYKFQAEKKLLVEYFGNKITERPEEFQQEKDKIFIGQFQSIREGVNISTADKIYMFNIDFSATSYIQSINRLQNMHRTKPARIVWLFSELGIEPKIYELVKNKHKNFTLTHFYKL